MTPHHSRHPSQQPLPHSHSSQWPHPQNHPFLTHPSPSRHLSTSVTPFMTAISSGLLPCGCHHHPLITTVTATISHCATPPVTAPLCSGTSPHSSKGEGVVQDSADSTSLSDSASQPSPFLDPIAHGLAEGLVLRCSHWDTKSTAKPRVCRGFSLLTTPGCQLHGDCLTTHPLGFPELIQVFPTCWEFPTGVYVASKEAWHDYSL